MEAFLFSLQLQYTTQIEKADPYQNGGFSLHRTTAFSIPLLYTIQTEKADCLSGRRRLSSLLSCYIQLRGRRLTPYQDGSLSLLYTAAVSVQLLYTSQKEKADSLSGWRPSLV